MTEPNQTVEQFIHAYLESVDILRSFLLMCGAGTQGVDALEIASKLYIQPQIAADILGRLESNGLAAAEGTPLRYRCQPRTPELAGLVAEVVKLDLERPVTLLNALYARPKGLQAFPDAFKLRKERND